MKTIGDKLVKISLALMIGLSVLLSWKIWTKPTNRNFDLINKKELSSVVQTKDIAEVYVPTKLFYHKTKDDILYTNRESTITDIQNKVSDFDFESVKKVSKEDNEKIMTQSKTVSLLFPKELPLSVYADTYHLKAKVLDDMNDININRILVSFEEEAVYFMSRNLEEGAKAEVKGNFDGIEKILNENKKYYSVSLEPDNISQLYYLTEELKLKTYSYIVATQSFTTFSKAFFNQSNDVFSNEGSNVSLSNGEGESLTIQSKTGEVNYFGKVKSPTNKVIENDYYTSFQYVESLGNSLGTLRYFGSNPENGDIVYRNYVEGYPVFGEDMRGLLEVAVQNKNVLVRTNQETIQIPIPSEEEVVLNSTREVLDDLLADGVDLDDVADIQIGYSWKGNPETKQVIELIPEWYILYQDTWIAKPELQNVLQKGGTLDGL